jgi:hypothetical protein
MIYVECVKAIELPRSKDVLTSVGLCIVWTTPAQPTFWWTTRVAVGRALVNNPLSSQQMSLQET